LLVILKERRYVWSIVEADHAKDFLINNCSAMRVDNVEEIMNLKDAFLCIDCDEVFTIEGSPCNSQCPRCASSVFAPLSAWVQTWTALENAQDETSRVARDGTSTKRPRLEMIHSTPIAA
jgi:hypothetical protein